MHKYLAFDLGASSGRGIIATLANGKISLREMNRFYNGMTNIHGSLFWDMYRLYDDIKRGIIACVNEGEKPDCIALDTWGVDYGLFGEDGNLLGVPYAYRDHRTDTAIQEVFEVMPKEKLYELTGIQFQQFNTVFQLWAAKRDKLPIMSLAKDLLFIPDIIDYFLTGVKKAEFTFATTSQLYNPHKGGWEKEIFDTLGLPFEIMQDIVAPGTVIGELTGKVCDETGIDAVKVAAVASHDTGSAIVAIPASNDNFAYISSGTWSLMGIETKIPVISSKSLEYNITNEGGVENTFRVLKNIMGMWLIQECKRIWGNQGKDYSYPELVEMAEKSTPFKIILDPDDKSFYNPDDMTVAIADFCKKTNQPVPESPGDFARCIYDSLALKYRYTLDQLREVSDKQIDKIHIIGGGSQNELLCQFTANASGMPVVAGPAEGTAIGNIMVQAMALGHVKSLGEARQIIQNSFEFKQYEPQDITEWKGAYETFLKIINQ